MFQHRSELTLSDNWTRTLVPASARGAYYFGRRTETCLTVKAIADLSGEEQQQLLAPLSLLQRNNPNFLNIKTTPFQAQKSI